MIIGRMINMKSDPKNGRSMLSVPPSAETTDERDNAKKGTPKVTSLSTFKSVSRIGSIFWVDLANFWRVQNKIQRLFVFGRHLEDVMTESRSGILLSFDLRKEQ